MRVVEASDRVRRARIWIWITIGFMLLAVSPWNGWWTLALFAPAGINLAILERKLTTSDRPERWAMGTMIFMMGLFATAIPLTGGAASPAVPLIMIPAAVTPMRFRGTVVAAFVALTAVALLVVTAGFDPAGFSDDPRLVLASIALMVCVTLASSALVEAEMTQRDAAVLDPLTGLLNRKALDVRIMELEQQARLTGASVAVIACDLDHFKQVNDTYGHDRGDAVLRSFAYQMRKALRSFELIYRLGGEEFLIILPGAGEEEGMLVAERLRSTAEKAEPGGLRITASFGVSAGAGDEVVYQICSRPRTKRSTAPRPRAATASSRPAPRRSRPRRPPPASPCWRPPARRSSLYYGAAAALAGSAACRHMTTQVATITIAVARKPKNPTGVKETIASTTASQPIQRGKPPWRRIANPRPRLKANVPMTNVANMSLFRALIACAALGSRSSAASARANVNPAKSDMPTTSTTPPINTAVERPPSSPGSLRRALRRAETKKRNAPPA